MCTCTSLHLSTTPSLSSPPIRSFLHVTAPHVFQVFYFVVLSVQYKDYMCVTLNLFPASAKADSPLLIDLFALRPCGYRFLVGHGFGAGLLNARLPPAFFSFGFQMRNSSSSKISTWFVNNRTSVVVTFSAFRLPVTHFKSCIFFSNHMQLARLWSSVYMYMYCTAQTGGTNHCAFVLPAYGTSTTHIAPRARRNFLKTTQDWPWLGL